MLHFVMGVGFEDIFTVLGKWTPPGFFQDFIDGYIKYFNSYK